MFEEVAESKCCGNPDRDCGGREMEAINAVQETERNEAETKNMRPSTRSRWTGRPPDRSTSLWRLEKPKNLEAFLITSSDGHEDRPHQAELNKGVPSG